MADKDTAATLTGVVEGETQDIDQVESQAQNQPVQVVVAPEKTERELAIDRIAATRNAKWAADEGAPTPDPKPAAEAAADPVVNTSTTTQLAQQLEDGTFVLDNSAMDKLMVRTKVNGVEELVPATKALAQYQKGAAADVKLAEAVRMSGEAAALLKDAQERAAAAATPAAKQDAAADVDAANARVSKVKEEMFGALYEGDTEKASKAFDEAVQAAVQAATAGRGSTATPTVAELVDAAVPAMKQRLSVESALDQLVTDYPELKDDADLVLVAENRRKLLVAQGTSPQEAIIAAGEYIGEKYKIGKFKATDVKGDAAATARAEKLAAKQRLDEPESTAARAATAVPVQKTASQVIAEMAAARAPQ